ncbi:sugar phosphate isomerase/epimerase family protein [Microbacterium sp. NPDC055903]
MHPRIGLCSITFRALDAPQLVALAAEAGLESIEWGGDVHVPAGDVVTAARVAGLTADAGLDVASYGSYFRAGAREAIEPVLDAADALGAERIRVWAGATGSAQASDAERSAVADRLRDAAIAAAERGIQLALEFHGGTLADDPASTRSLLDEVDHPALSTYWQPSVGATAEVAIGEYLALADRVSAVHVFSWRPRTERLALDDRADLWRGLFAASVAHPPRDALLEFVPDDDPALLGREAASLRAFREYAFQILGSAS